jgi:hypothetical protein
MANNFPQEIGSRISILSSYENRRSAEADGFYPEIFLPDGTAVMRRDLPSGRLKTEF